MLGHAKGPAVVCLQGTVLPWVMITCQVLLCATQVITREVCIVYELCNIWLLQQL